MKKKPAAKNDDVKCEPYVASLKVELTAEEVADRANQAAHTLKERDQTESDLKAHAKHMKSIVDELEAKLRKLSEEVRSESTYRPVDCERRFDYSAGTYSEVRLDTGEVMHERPLTEAEKQRELPFGANA